MSERALMIAAVRAEVVGPSQPLAEPTVIAFADRLFSDPLPNRRGAITWRSSPGAAVEEVLYFDRETPHRKYGAGMLHPETQAHAVDPAEAAAAVTDTLGVDTDGVEDANPSSDDDSKGDDDEAESSPAVEDFDVTSLDVRHPSTIGLSCCVSLGGDGSVTIRLPSARMLTWQPADAAPVQLNGRYEQCKRSWKDERNLSARPPFGDAKRQ